MRYDMSITTSAVSSVIPTTVASPPAATSSTEATKAGTIPLPCTQIVEVGGEERIAVDLNTIRALHEARNNAISVHVAAAMPGRPAVEQTSATGSVHASLAAGDAAHATINASSGCLDASRQGKLHGSVKASVGGGIGSAPAATETAVSILRKFGCVGSGS